MINLQNITTQDDKSLERIQSELAKVYSRLPSTKGCMESIKAEGGCAAWCCEVQNPQVLYSEFCNSWRHVNKTWDRNSVIALVAAALRNYLSNDKNKGCVFWDRDSKLCTQHDARPFACRTYGVMPEDEWKPRYEQLKVINPGIRPQCDRVVTEDGTPVTKQQTDAWWELVRRVESSLGVPHARMNDKPGGTYRTYHDHIILSLYSGNVLRELTKMRLNESPEGKERFVRTVVHMLRNQPQPPKPVEAESGGSGQEASDGDGAQG